MRIYLSIIKYPAIGWLLYITVWVFPSELIGTDTIKKFCGYGFYYFFLGFLCMVLLGCYKNNFDIRKTFFVCFSFSYGCFAIEQILIIYSESRSIQGFWDIITASLSLLVDPFWQSHIAGFVSAGLYIIVKKTGIFLKNKAHTYEK